MEDPEFRRLLAQEEFIETFLYRIDDEMRKRGVTRAELASRMGCTPNSIIRIINRTKTLTAATMVDIALSLGLKLKIEWEMMEER